MEKSLATGEVIVGGEAVSNSGADKSPATGKIIVGGDIEKLVLIDVDDELVSSADEEEDEISKGRDSTENAPFGPGLEYADDFNLDNEQFSSVVSHIKKKKTKAYVRLENVGFKRERRFKSVTTPKAGFD